MPLGKPSAQFLACKSHTDAKELANALGMSTPSLLEDSLEVFPA